MLRFLAICVLLINYSYGLQLPIRYTPSLRMKMYQDGTLKDYIQRKNVIQSNSQTSTPVIDYEDMAYMVEITLGTPAQQFVVFLDSGSANLWVPDESCAQGAVDCGSYCSKTTYSSCLTFCNAECCKKTPESKLATVNPCASKRRFNAGLSSTYLYDSGRFDITYQTGEVKGYQGADTFCFANTSVCATEQVFGQATSIGGDFEKQPEDGLLGLGWPSIAVNGVTPPMFQLMNQGKLAQPIFIVYMAGVGHTTALTGGALTIGEMDTTNCGTPNYVPLTSQTFWQFKMNSVSAGTYSNNPGSGWQAVSDTASTFITAPQSVVTGLAHAVGAYYIPEFGTYFIGCHKDSPDIVININGNDYNIRAKNYILPVGDGLCMFGFIAKDATGFYPSFMFGPPFIREYCAVHDMQNSQIGFAPVLNK